MRKVLKLVIIVLVVLIVVVAGALFGISKVRGSGEQKPEIGIMYEFPHRFFVDLRDDNRYVKLELELEIEDEKLVEELEKREVQIQDTITGILRSKTYAKLKGKDGQELLRKEILESINALLVSGKVKWVYLPVLALQ